MGKLQEKLSPLVIDVSHSDMKSTSDDMQTYPTSHKERKLV